MTQPGTPAAAMPADEATFGRRLADLERAVRELGPSVAASFNSTVAKVVSFNSIGVAATGFALSGGFTTLVSGTAVVPDGFNNVTVMAIGTLSANNTGAFDQYLTGQAAIDGAGGGHANQLAHPSRLAAVAASAIRTKNVAPGQVITVEMRGTGGGGWAASGTNGAHIDAILLFRKV